MNKRSLIAGVLSVCLMLAMLPAAFAVEQGEANITPQTTMKELRENPSIKGSGYYTYCREMLPIESLYWQNKTLAQYAKPELVEDCAQAMNLVVENYNNGVQVSIRRRRSRRILRWAEHSCSIIQPARRAESMHL